MNSCRFWNSSPPAPSSTAAGGMRVASFIASSLECLTASRWPFGYRVLRLPTRHAVVAALVSCHPRLRLCRCSRARISLLYRNAAGTGARKQAMSEMLLFSPLAIRGLELRNRIVVPPMHQYSAVKGFPTDWHVMNAGKFAAGGAGLVVVESTKVERRGLGTLGV